MWSARSFFGDPPASDLIELENIFRFHSLEAHEAPKDRTQAPKFGSCATHLPKGPLRLPAELSGRVREA